MDPCMDDDTKTPHSPSAASTAAAAAAAAADTRPYSLTRSQKKHFVAHPELALPLRALGSEFRLHSKACSPAEGGSKNCRHNVACMHGLGWKKKGIWDATKGGAAVLSLLGSNPHWRELAEDSHVGLRNLGATCYLNSLFQCLYMNSAFRNAVYQFEPPTQPMPHMLLPPATAAPAIPRPQAPLDSLEAADEVAAVVAAGMEADASKNDEQKDQGLPPVLSEPVHLHHIQSLFTHLQHSMQAPYDPSHLVKSLGVSMVEQQDVHEFMNLLVFQVLERVLLASANPICRALIPKLFTGSIVNVMEGQNCHHTSERISEFHDLSQIQIKGKKKLEDCLDCYFQPERMEHDKPEYRWKCSECGQRENALRHTFLKDPPPILILQLGRFEFDAQTMSKKKLADSIKLPQFLDLTKYLQVKKDAPAPAPAAATATTVATAAAATPAASTTVEPITTAIPAPAPVAPAASAAAATVPSSPIVASSSASVAESVTDATAPAETDPTVKGKRGGRSAAASKPAAAKPVRPSRKRNSNSLETQDEAAAPAPVSPVAEQPASPPVPHSSLSSLRVAPAPVPVAKPGRKRASTKGKKKGSAVSAPASADAMEDEPQPSPTIDLTEELPSLPPITAPPVAERHMVLAESAPAAAAAAASPAATEAASSSPAAAAAASTMESDEAMARALQAGEVQVSRRRGGGGGAASKRPPRKSPARAAAGSKDAAIDVDAPDHPAPKQQKTKPGQAATNRVTKKEIAAQQAAAAAAAESAVPALDTDASDAVPVDGVTIDANTKNLDLSGPNIYELVAVVLHKGPSANRGHYTAEIKDLERGEWFSFDDGVVTRKGAAARAKKKTEEAKQQEDMIDATTHESASHHVESTAPAEAQAASTAAPASPALAPAPSGDVVPMDEDVSGSTPAATPIVIDDAPVQESSAPVIQRDVIDVEADAQSDVEPATPTTASAKKKRGGGRKKKNAETAPVAPARSKRVAAQFASALITADAVDNPAASPPAQAAPAKRTGRAVAKKFEELDDEERGDESDYDFAADEKPTKKGRGGGKSKKQTAAEAKAKKAADKSATAKSDKKADLSVGAASTAYVLIYRRRDTMRPEWNPFEEEEKEMRLLAAAGSTMMDTNEGGAAAASSSSTVAAASSGSIFLQSKAPSIFLSPVLESNAAFSKELRLFDDREKRLMQAVKDRQQLAERIMDELAPDRFEVVAKSLEHFAPQPPPVKVESPATTQPETPTGSSAAASSAGSSNRRSSRKPAVKPEPSSTPPSTPPVDAESTQNIKPLSELQMGHYVPTAWLSAFLTGWVIEKEKEETTAADATASAASAAATSKEESAVPKERVTEDLTGDAKGEVDEEMKEEVKTEAPAAADASAAPAATAAASSSSAAASSAAPTAATAVAPAPAPRVRTALQQFLDAHPENDSLPFPGDLLENSLATLKCEHGKLHPLRLSGAKRISCKAYAHLMEANAAWKAQQSAKTKAEEEEVMIVDRPAPPAPLPHSESPASTPSPTQLDHLHISCTAAAASSSSSSAASPCCCLSCAAPGFTDADLCQECARLSLLGETILADQWTKSRAIWDTYVSWDTQRRAEEAIPDKEPVFEAGFHVSAAWWKSLKRELDAAAKALGFETIVPVKVSKRAAAKGGAAAAAAAAASGSSVPTAPKPLPTISQNVDITADIICPHGGLKPGKPGSKSSSASFHVSPEIWKMMLELHPTSRPVPAVAAPAEEGAEPVHECAICIADAAEAASSLKDRRDKIKAEKGKLKLVRSKAAWSDFPLENKAPTDGLYHLVPASWAEELYEYFLVNQQAAGMEDAVLARPKPMSTADLVCKHGKLLFTPMPEDDKSMLPTVAIAAAAAAAPSSAAVASSSSAAAAASASASPPPPLSLALKAKSTPPGILALCDDQDYRHLKSQNWIDGSTLDLTMIVSKNPRNLNGDLGVSSWSGIEVSCNPKPCDAGCIEARVRAEHHDSLDFEEELIKLYRIKPDEKVEDEQVLNLAAAMMDGRRASARRKAPTGRPVSKKPVEIRVSSTDQVYVLKLKINQACNMLVNHQEIIWLKEDQTTVILSDDNKTLRDYNLPANADLRLKMNAKGVQSEYDEAHGKPGLEQGFRGTALSSAPMPSVAGAAAAAAASSAATSAAAANSPALAPSPSLAVDVPASSLAAAVPLPPIAESMDVDASPLPCNVPQLPPAVENPDFALLQHSVPEPKIKQAQLNKFERSHPTDVEAEESKQGMEDEHTAEATETARATIALVKQESDAAPDNDAAMQAEEEGAPVLPDAATADSAPPFLAMHSRIPQD